jgi:predicted TIM-barrel fold metal-dependent hydrolase
MNQRVDTHTHMSDGSFGGTGYSAAEYVAKLDEFDVMRAWISPCSGLYANGEFRAANDELFRFCSYSPERFEPFCTVNPNYGATKCVDELRRCSETYGCRGLKLHPWMQAFPISTRSMGDITECCISLGMTLFFHDGTPPYASTLQIANLAERYPEATVVLGHAGLIENYNSAIRSLKRLPNLYASMTGPSIFQLQKMVDSVSANKLMIGTDFGFARNTSALEYRLQMWDYVHTSEETREWIDHKTAFTLMP